MLEGPYQRLEEVGRGSVSRVFRAMGPQGEVALKQLRLPDADYRALIIKRAHSVRPLVHSRVVRIFDAGLDSDGVVVVQQFVRGRDLSKRNDASVAERLRAFIDAGQGLHGAHTQGFSHGSFAADRLIIDDQNAKVLVRGFEDVAYPAEWGVLPRRVDHTAPELLRTGLPTPRSDQFAFCCALHQMIWGTPAFPAECETEAAAAIRSNTPSLFPNTPPHIVNQPLLEGVILRGLSHRPEARFDSMRALVGRLRQVTPSTGP